MRVLVLDIGGTSAKYLIHETDNAINSKITSFSTRELRKEELLLAISDVINENKIDVVSISSPGAIINKSYVSGLTGIKDYSNFDFKEEILEKVKNKKLKVFLINDANAALLSQISESNKHLDIALISIGTGIGGSLFIDGKIREGKRGLSGEFGYKIFDENDNVSLASSARAMETKFSKLFNEKLTAKDIMENYDNSKESKEIVDLIVENNAINIFNIFYSFDIDLFILSGGVTQSDYFVELIKNKTQNLSNEKGSGAIINIKASEAKQNSGILGALKFAKTNI